MTELVSGAHNHNLFASRQTNKVYPHEDPANQDSGRARKESRRDRRVDRRDRWFAASHLLKGLRKLVLEAQVRGTRFWRARRHARYTSDGERPSSSKRRLLNIAAFNREQDSINYLIMEI